MNSIWNKNIQAFKLRFPQLADFYSHIIEDINAHGDQKDIFSFWTIMNAKNGSLTAQINTNMLLHSSYNPEREGMSTAQQLAAKNKECVIFMGAGLGWQFCSLAKLINNGGLAPSTQAFPVKKLVLVEPDPIHFFGALFYIDWTEVFKVEQLVIALGCPLDSLMPLLEGNNVNIGDSGVSAAYVYAIPAFINHARPYFDSVIALIERNRNKNEINAATYKKFEKLWIRNSMKNIREIEQRGRVSQLAGAFSGKDFIVLAAGPSLQTLLPKIKEYKNKAILVCVETALHALLKCGVQPDFIVITDPQYYAYKHIAGLEAPQSILVCPLSVYPAVFRFKCREILLCSEMFPVSSYFEKEMGSFGDLGAGGSVASSAWTLCKLLGAANIYLAGLDLSYPMGQTHIKGSSAEQKSYILADRLSPLQKFNSSSRFNARPEYAFDYDGNQVLTDARMKMFAWWFESTIAANPQIKTYTLCRQSMKIPGVEVADAPSTGSGTAGAGSAIAVTDSEFQAQFDKTLTSFYSELKALTALINQAVEKCLIGGPGLTEELAQIENQIAASPLAEIVRLANPGLDDKLETYRSLQKTMEIYNKYSF